MIFLMWPFDPVCIAFASFASIDEKTDLSPRFSCRRTRPRRQKVHFRRPLPYRSRSLLLADLRESSSDSSCLPATYTRAKCLSSTRTSWLPLRRVPRRLFAKVEHLKTSNSDKQKAKSPTVSEGTNPHERGRRGSKRPHIRTLPRNALHTCISPESVALPRNR